MTRPCQRILAGEDVAVDGATVDALNAEHRAEIEAALGI